MLAESSMTLPLDFRRTAKYYVTVPCSAALYCGPLPNGTSLLPQRPSGLPVGLVQQRGAGPYRRTLRLVVNPR